MFEGWFRRRGAAPEAKASAVAPVLSLHTQGRPRWSPRDYGAMARAGFMTNPVAYRVVRMIAEAAASVPLVLYEGAAELDGHPLLDLVARPNAAETGGALLERVYAGLMIAGNAYVECVRLEERPRELYALRADRVTIVPGPDGWPAAFAYQAGGRSVRLVQADVLHLKLFHPVDDHYGLSPLEAAGQAIDLHNAMAGWNKALLDNAARPSGALVFKGAAGETMSDEQFARLKSELTAMHTGARRSGAPLVLDGGLEWRPMGLTPQEMDFDRGRNAAARDIAMAFGVPPMLLGVPGDATYANYEQANLAFWRQTVLPLVGRVCAGLSAWLGPAFGGGLRLGADIDGVEALSAERAHLWSRLEAANFITRDEKRVAAGYGVESSAR
jgi:HK97 family phage portal protein